jgi:hypothetical protein
MSGLQDISFENEARIRKALISISIFTLVISNVELASNKLDFFGLEIAVSIEKISAVLQLTILFLLAGLFLLLAERAPRLIAGVLRTRDEKWWKKLLPELGAYQSAHDPKTGEDDYLEYRRDNPDWDDELYLEKHQRSQKREHVLRYFRPIALFSRSMTKYGLPVGLALIALFFPQSILVLG